MVEFCEILEANLSPAGQRVFDDNGLPPPPVSEPHRASANEPTPCFVQDRKHYFLPQNCIPPLGSPHKPSKALQALHKTAEAAAISRPAEFAKSGVVIVNGSNIPKQPQVPANKAYKKKTDELESQNDPRRTSSMPETSSPVISGADLELRRSKTLLAVDNETPPSSETRRSSESVTLSNGGQKLPDNLSSIKKEGIETKMDNFTREISANEHREQYTNSVIQPNGERTKLVSSKIYPHQSQGIERSD
jgi:hypothetical protein